jgi:8-oxo-dGTP diphosphatase
VTTIGVCGVVQNAPGQVVLIRTEKAGWELPGGRLEPGEDVHAALKREVHEETGYTLGAIGGITGLYAHTHTGDTLLLVVVRASVDEAVAPEPLDDEDSLEAAWFAPERALDLITNVSERQRLADALSTSESIDLAYRVYS